MHIYGGKLYGTSTTGHMLLLVLMFPNGLNPSLAKPSLTLRFSEENGLSLQQNVFLVTNFSEENFFVTKKYHIVTKFKLRHSIYKKIVTFSDEI